MEELIDSRRAIIHSFFVRFKRKHIAATKESIRIQLPSIWFTHWSFSSSIAPVWASSSKSCRKNTMKADVCKAAGTSCPRREIPAEDSPLFIPMIAEQVTAYKKQGAADVRHFHSFVIFKISGKKAALFSASFRVKKTPFSSSTQTVEQRAKSFPVKNKLFNRSKPDFHQVFPYHRPCYSLRDQGKHSLKKIIPRTRNGTIKRRRRALKKASPLHSRKCFRSLQLFCGGKNLGPVGFFP